jgi:hypothetical protein
MLCDNQTTLHANDKRHLHKYFCSSEATDKLDKKERTKTSKALRSQRIRKWRRPLDAQDRCLETKKILPSPRQKNATACQMFSHRKSINEKELGHQMTEAFARMSALTL